jgi:hypothetical protein
MTSQAAFGRSLCFGLYAVIRFNISDLSSVTSFGPFPAGFVGPLDTFFDGSGAQVGPQAYREAIRSARLNTRILFRSTTSREASSFQR